MSMNYNSYVSMFTSQQKLLQIGMNKIDNLTADNDNASNGSKAAKTKKSPAGK